MITLYGDRKRIQARALLLGVSAPGGVPGGVCSGGGVSAPRGLPGPGGCGIPACTEADPPVNRMTDRHM